MLQWSGENPEMMMYDHSRDVLAALENRDTILRTCPIGAQKAGKLILNIFCFVGSLLC